MDKKKIITLSVGLALIAVAVVVLVYMLTGGNQAWQPTIEEALEFDKTSRSEDFEGGQYEIRKTVDKIYYNNSAYWLYESESNELAMYGFIYSESKDKWQLKISGSFDYIDNLFGYESDPLQGTYAMTIDDENLWGCRPHDGLIPYVNGEKARIYATYNIEYNGITYSIDWWDVLGFDTNLYDTVKIEFLPE